MKDQLFNEIQRRMLPYLNNEQLMQLRNAMSEALQGITLCYEDDRLAPEKGDTTEVFISAKRSQSSSSRTSVQQALISADFTTSKQSKSRKTLVFRDFLISAAFVLFSKNLMEFDKV